MATVVIDCGTNAVPNAEAPSLGNAYDVYCKKVRHSPSESNHKHNQDLDSGIKSEGDPENSKSFRKMVKSSDQLVSGFPGIEGFSRKTQEFAQVKGTYCKMGFASHVSKDASLKSSSSTVVENWQSGAEEYCWNPMKMKINNTKSGDTECADPRDVNGGGKVGCDGKVGGDCTLPLKIRVIDETALIETLNPVQKSRNGCGRDKGGIKKKGKEKGKNVERVYKKQVREEKEEKNGNRFEKWRCKLRSGGKKGGVVTVSHKEEETKTRYSRVEMEGLRYLEILQQRKLWKGVYDKLGADVAREYDDLASIKHQKNIKVDFDPRRPLLPGVVASRGRWSQLKIFVH